MNEETGTTDEGVNKTTTSGSAVHELVMPIILGIDKKLDHLIPFAWLREDNAMVKHGQSLEQLANRGGVSPSEAVALMHGWQDVTDKVALGIINHMLDGAGFLKA